MTHLSETQESAIDREQRAAIGSQPLLGLRSLIGECFIPLRGNTPHHFSCLQLNAYERRIGFVSPIEGIQVSVLVDSGVPMCADLLRCPGDAIFSVRKDVQ